MRTTPGILGLLLILGFAGAAAGQGQLFPGREFPTAVSPVEIEKGDFNGDGKPDVATCNYNANNVSLLFNDGLGGFLPPVNLNCGNSPAGIAVADLDNNGWLDIVTANQGSNNASVLLNSGGGAFLGAANFAAGSAAQALTTGDFNNDGLRDLAVVNLSSNNVSIIKNLGGGTFAAPVNFAVQTSPVAIATANLNGDIRPDLVVINQSSASASVLLGLAGGNFAAAVNYSAGSGAHDVALLDFSGDGIIDLAIANQSGAGTITTYAGSGTGTFAGKIDTPVGSNLYSIDAADVDGNGKPDLVITRAQSNVFHVLLGSGTFFMPEVRYAAGADCGSGAIADYNNDGKLDFATCNFKQATVSLFLGNGNGTFQTASFYEAPYLGRSLALGDLNGDGMPDAVLAKDNSAEIQVLLGAPGGGLNALTTLPLATTNAVVLADVNNDGNLDLLGSNPAAQTVSVMLGLGNGFLNPPTTNAVSGTPQMIVVADQDLDGLPDFFAGWTAGGTHGIGVYRRQLAGGFVFFTNIPLGSAPTCLASGNSNLDTLPDLVLGDTSGILAEILNFGTSFSPPNLLATLPQISACAFGDLNHDGLDDIAATHGTSPGSTSVLLNSQTGFSGVSSVYVFETKPTGIAMADFDRDGHVDLAISNKTGTGANLATGSVAVLTNTGAGTFTSQLVFGAGRDSLQVQASDLNGDGRCDLVVTNNNGALAPQEPISILLNTLPDAAPLVHVGPGTPGCYGKLGLNVNSAPAIGNPFFAFTCTNAPRKSFGLVLVGNQLDFAGSDTLFVGVLMHVNLFTSTELLAFDSLSDAGGTAVMVPAPIPLNPSLVGANYDGQMFWVEQPAIGAACGPSPFLLVSSEALQITIQ